MIREIGESESGQLAQGDNLRTIGRTPLGCEPAFLEGL